MDFFFDWIYLHSGAVLLQRGIKYDAVYRIESGRIRKLKNIKSSQNQEMTELTKGSTLHDMEIITEEPSRDTAYAIRDTQLSVMSKTVFHYIAKTRPKDLLHFTKMVSGMNRNRIASSSFGYDSVSV